MKVRELIKLVEKDGWFHTRTKGSHRQFHHLNKTGTVTIPGHMNDDVAIGTLKSIYKQAQIKK